MGFDIECYRRELKKNGDCISLDIWYPGTPGNEVKAVQIGLMDVRAADSIRIEYDYDRDGWIVKQAQVFEWPADDTASDPEWKEVAFICAWASERK